MLVHFNGHTIRLQRAVMTTLGLRAGQTIDEPTFWRALDLNCASMRACVEAAQNFDPDIRRHFEEITGLLEEMIARNQKDRP